METKQTVDSSSRSSADRLRDALAKLVRQQIPDGAPRVLTATALCQLAGISRNALYRYHPDILHALRKAQRMRHSDPSRISSSIRQLRDENDAMRGQLVKLAALVDHYYAAWKENLTLLERRDRELAELRRDIISPVTHILKQQ